MWVVVDDIARSPDRPIIVVVVDYCIIALTLFVDCELRLLCRRRRSFWINWRNARRMEWKVGKDGCRNKNKFPIGERKKETSTHRHKHTKHTLVVVVAALGLGLDDGEIFGI